MKSQVIFRRLISLIIISAGVFILNGCAIYAPQYQASLPVDNIVNMSREGVPSKDIIRKIRSSRSVYELPASELAKLKNEGVQDSVLNFMQKTHLDAVRRAQRIEDSYYGYPGMFWDPYFGFGYPYYSYFGYGFPYRYRDWGPVVVVPRSGGEHHSGSGRRH